LFKVVTKDTVIEAYNCFSTLLIAELALNAVLLIGKFSFCVEMLYKYTFYVKCLHSYAVKNTLCQPEMLY